MNNDIKYLLIINGLLSVQNIKYYVSNMSYSAYTKIYFYLMFTIIGMCMGSFLNCIAYRITHNISIMKGRSKCDNCGHILNIQDLIPIISFLILKGKCRYCKSKLDKQYLYSEIISSLVYLITIFKFGLSLKTGEYLILFSLMLCASFADIEAYIIPNRLIVLGIINRVLFYCINKGFNMTIVNSLFQGLIITIPLFVLVMITNKILNKETMGGGDIKLIFMISMYVSVNQSLLAILLACIIGIIYVYITNKQKEQFPFGPCLCIGYFLSIIS